MACRWIQWFLGLALAANVTAMARPGLGRRAWWAGAIVLLAPAISNGMSAPLNDVALAAFGAAAIFAWTRLLDRPGRSAAVVAGGLAGLAIGVKYPALVLVGLMGGFLWLRGLKGLFRQGDLREGEGPASLSGPGSPGGSPSREIGPRPLSGGPGSCRASSACWLAGRLALPGRSDPASFGRARLLPSLLHVPARREARLPRIVSATARSRGPGSSWR